MHTHPYEHTYVNPIPMSTFEKLYWHISISTKPLQSSRCRRNVVFAYHWKHDAIKSCNKSIKLRALVSKSRLKSRWIGSTTRKITWAQFAWSKSLIGFNDSICYYYAHQNLLLQGLLGDEQHVLFITRKRERRPSSSSSFHTYTTRGREVSGSAGHMRAPCRSASAVSKCLAGWLLPNKKTWARRPRVPVSERRDRPDQLQLISCLRMRVVTDQLPSRPCIGTLAGRRSRSTKEAKIWYAWITVVGSSPKTHELTVRSSLAMDARMLPTIRLQCAWYSDINISISVYIIWFVFHYQKEVFSVWSKLKNGAATVCPSMILSLLVIDKNTFHFQKL